MSEQKINEQAADQAAKTLDVVPNILFDAEFAEQVRVHNGFPEGLDQKDIAILFLTGRFQWAITVLTQRTDTLARKVDSTDAPAPDTNE